MKDSFRLARAWTLAIALSLVSCGGSDNKGTGPSSCDPQFVIVAGDGQTGGLGTGLPDTLVVQATTCDEADPEGPQIPETDVRVVWRSVNGGGTVNGLPADTVLTDGDGFARAVWVLGSIAGGQVVSATAMHGGPEALLFHATAVEQPTGCPPNSLQHPGGFFTSDETWGPGGHVVTGNVAFGGSATLTISAGAHVCLEGGGIEITEESHLVVQGTEENPVYIETSFAGAISFGVSIDALTTPSTIVNARLERVPIMVFGWFHPVVIERTLVRDAEVVIGAPGSQFRQSTIVRGRLGVYATNGGPILVEVTVRDFSQEGIFINGSGVTLSGCEVSGCGSDGVISAGDATTIHINDCNFFGNDGAGVWNGGVARLDATGNWWGDPAGPDGSNGDGVFGDVDYSGFLTSPATLGYRPPE